MRSEDANAMFIACHFYILFIISVLHNILGNDAKWVLSTEPDKIKRIIFKYNCRRSVINVKLMLFSHRDEIVLK